MKSESLAYYSPARVWLVGTQLEGKAQSEDILAQMSVRKVCGSFIEAMLNIRMEGLPA